MNWYLLIAGALILGAAGIHGGFGEAWVVRRISLESLPHTAFGGQRMSMTMIRVSWHFVTLIWLVMGAVLLVAPSASVARLVAIVFTVLSAVVVAGALRRGPRRLFAHPAPLMLALIALLAWRGSF